MQRTNWLTLVAIAILATPLAARADYTSTVLADNPMAYWQFEEADEFSPVADSSGNGYTASYYGGVGLGTAGISGNAATFSRDYDSYVALPGTWGGAATPAMSFETWFKPNSSIDDQVVLGWSNSDPAARECVLLELHTPNGATAPNITTTAFNQDGGVGWVQDSTSMTSITLNKWHHLVYTISADGNATSYFDGELKSQLTFATTYQYLSPATLQVGQASLWTPADFAFSGQIDEVAIYDSVLTPEQVSAHYYSVMAIPGNETFTDGDFSDGLNGWQTWSDADTTAPEMSVSNEVATISRANGADTWSTGVIYQVVNVPEGTKVRVDGKWAGDMSSLATGDMWWGEVSIFSMPNITEEKIAAVFDYPGYLQNYIAEGETNRGGSYAAGSDIINSFGSTLPTWAMEDIDNSQYDWEAAKTAFEAAGITWDPTQRLEYNFTEVESCGQVVVALKFGGQAGGEISFDNIALTVVPDNIPGDANKDGKVDGSDVTILAGNWQYGVTGGGATWEMGDFNGDGKVDGSDVTILAGNWQAGVTTASAAVPEPGNMILLLSAISSLLIWKRSK